MSLVALLSPFTYQSVFIPILPNNLTDILDAPVPFILGMTHIPEENTKVEVIIFDIATNKFVQKPELPQLPRCTNFKKELEEAKEATDQHFKACGDGRSVAPKTSEEETLFENICQAYSLFFSNYLFSFFANFRTYTLSDRTFHHPVTVFLKEFFLRDELPEDRPFFQLFFETQMFRQFCDFELQAIDDFEKKWPTLKKKKEEDNENSSLPNIFCTVKENSKQPQ
eukprot:CAMPEP_0174277844 /NCGR_PEP_ID=MMETSP0439-20130205/61154_1 /TAXON_ID=0 /ORGANISM="Stereomyxa ramosa, Strain Chinc5" /LENGTH=224 /DNA_ID=CAMNT_0015370199 /DNA_START=1210 /DNA_END=1881 /DNA_ORIENTATION=+